MARSVSIFFMAKSTFVFLRARCAATVQPSRAMQARSSQGQSHREPTPRARQTPNVPKQVRAGHVFPPKATASQQLVPHVRRGAALREEATWRVNPVGRSEHSSDSTNKYRQRCISRPNPYPLENARVFESRCLVTDVSV